MSIRHELVLHPAELPRDDARGDITVESTVGEGSSFEVVIPLPQGLDAPEDRIARVDSGADW